MRTFKQGNWENTNVGCPICNTQDKGEVILIPIDGTKQGNNIEAVQTHTTCLQKELMFYPETSMFAIKCPNYYHS